jgi:phosphatidylserine/phosphatidylglycerophosphate/cardiolipin synthase-like enzyme
VDLLRSDRAGGTVTSDAAVDWLLTADERGNPATAIDAEHGDGHAWTAGNHVTVHVDGTAYFTRLHELLSGLGPGDWIYLTDWRIDATRELTGPGSELGPLLASLARRGVAIRGLLWRSHPALVRFNQDANRVLSTLVNRAGGQLVADQRVRRFGSHHQKLLVVHRPNDPIRCIAFVGGIDLARGRRDDPEHLGDADPVRIDPRYGWRPPWHDLQLELAGPAVLDVDLTFRERWEDPSHPDHRNPLRAMWRRFSHEPRRLELLQRRLSPPQVGSHTVQVLRTYPARRRVIPFAPDGERSIARAYLKALARARSLVYIEDQYLWGTLVADALAAALRRSPDLRMTIVVPRYPDRDGRLSGRAARAAQWRAINNLVSTGGPRVAVYDVENEHGTPIYVHAKAVMIDDVGRWSARPTSTGAPGPTTPRSPARSSTRNATPASRPTRVAWATGPGCSPASYGCACGASTSGSGTTTPTTPGCWTRSEASRPGGRPRPGSRPGTMAAIGAGGHPDGSGLTKSSWLRPSRPAGRRPCTGSRSTPTAGLYPYDAIRESSPRRPCSGPAPGAASFVQTRVGVEPELLDCDLDHLAGEPQSLSYQLT